MQTFVPGKKYKDQNYKTDLVQQYICVQLNIRYEA